MLPLPQKDRREQNPRSHRKCDKMRCLQFFAKCATYNSLQSAPSIILCKVRCLLNYTERSLPLGNARSRLRLQSHNRAVMNICDIKKQLQVLIQPMHRLCSHEAVLAAKLTVQLASDMLPVNTVVSLFTTAFLPPLQTSLTAPALLKATLHLRPMPFPWACPAGQ